MLPPALLPLLLPLLLPAADVEDEDGADDCEKDDGRSDGPVEWAVPISEEEPPRVDEDVVEDDVFLVTEEREGFAKEFSEVDDIDVDGTGVEDEGGDVTVLDAP